MSKQNLYFFSSSEPFLVNQEIKNLSKIYNLDVVNIFYEKNEDIEKIIFALDNVDLFLTKKIYVIKDLIFFEKSINKKDEFLTEQLINAIEKTEHIVIFNNSNILKEKDIYQNFFTKKLISQMNMKIKMLNSLNENELINFVIDKVKENGGSINFVNASLLISKTANNLSLINTEIEKLLNFEKNIQTETINSLVETINIDDPFGFVNSIESNDFAIIWQKYYEKLVLGTPISMLIAQLSQHLILCHQIYAYYSINKSLDQLANDLKINIFRVKKVNQSLKKMGIKKVKHLLIALANLDHNIKNGLIDEQKGFEHFLIKYFV
ncbi:DNA polymerase III subunit delta [Mycoplasmopsis columbina]|uniref:DNA polymerase III subunit delta n=1 Tax=Mycoplasmopsis columbina TaxID=114881 RepID=UPI0005872859|nr:hypothetical protein [Mycoplasmopsis columbina]